MLPTKQIQQTKQDILQWFYEQAKENRLTGTAQRLWYWLFTQLSMVQPGRFYEISSRTLANELGVCLKSIERGRKALQQSGLLHYEVRGKSVYYRLLLPEKEKQRSLDCARDDKMMSFRPERSGVEKSLRTLDYAQNDDAITTAQQLAELVAKLEDYAQQVAQLQAQLAEQCVSTDIISTELARTSALEERSEGSFSDYHFDRSGERFILEQEKQRTLDCARDDTIITNSKDYAVYKQKQTRQPDILFNDKYEILLWDYLNKYKDNRFAEACYHHFIMLKNLYQQKGKKKLTETGFYNIMNELEQLSGNDMTLKLAIMERSLRNNWAGFFPLPDNTPEHKKAEKKKQGRKRSSYRNQHRRSHYDSFQPREGRDLEYLVQ